MKTIEFKLPRTLHDGDSFTNKLVICEKELWYGFNKNMTEIDIKDYLKLMNSIMFSFSFSPELTFLSLPISLLPKHDGWLTGGINSYYDITTTAGTCHGGVPLCLEKETVIFTLTASIMDRKYIRFKKEPTILINIFSKKGD